MKSYLLRSKKIALFLVVAVLFIGAVFGKGPGVVYVDRRGLAWRGVHPGLTTESYLKTSIGLPGNVSRCDIGEGFHGVVDYIEYYYGCLVNSERYEYYEDFGEVLPRARHKIYFEGDTVRLIIEDVQSYPEDRVIYIEEFIDRYGQPEAVYRSRLPHYSDVALYCSMGVVLHYTPTGRVGYIYYFRPMTTNSCRYLMRDSIGDSGVGLAWPARALLT